MLSGRQEGPRRRFATVQLGGVRFGGSEEVSAACCARRIGPIEAPHRYQNMPLVVSSIGAIIELSAARVGAPQHCWASLYVWKRHHSKHTAVIMSID